MILYLIRVNYQMKFETGFKAKRINSDGGTAWCNYHFISQVGAVPIKRRVENSSLQ